MKLVSTILLISVLSIGVLGLVGFSEDSQSAFMACVRNLLSDVCSVAGLGMGVNHAGVFASFSLGIVLVLVALVSIFFSGYTKLVFPRLPISRFVQLLKLYSFNLKKQTRFWLGLFEKKEEHLV